MDCTKILPLGRAHFGTRLGRAWRGLGEEGHDQTVGFLNEEAAQFVEP